MDTNLPPTLESAVAAPISPAAYRQLYGRSVMVLRQLRAATPAPDELCRITSVNTLAPGLWITAKFLDGSVRSFRPDMIQPSLDLPAEV